MKKPPMEILDLLVSRLYEQMPQGSGRQEGETDMMFGAFSSSANRMNTLCTAFAREVQLLIANGIAERMLICESGPTGSELLRQFTNRAGEVQLQGIQVNTKSMQFFSSLTDQEMADCIIFAVILFRQSQNKKYEFLEKEFDSQETLEPMLCGPMR